MFYEVRSGSTLFTHTCLSDYLYDMHNYVALFDIPFFSISKDDVLTIDYTAKTSKACPVNFTNHSYFNLGGQVGIIIARNTKQAGQIACPT